MINPPDPPELASTFQKIDWAKRHAAKLKDEVRRVTDPNGHEFVFKFDSERQKHAVFVDGVPDVTIEIQLIVGDVLHALRSALEHVAWQLVKLDGQDPSERTVFPVRESPFRSRDDSRLVAAHMKPAIRCREIMDVVDRVQPYYAVPDTWPEVLPPGWRDPHTCMLWMVDRLWNIDKHRLLLVMICGLDVDQMWWGSNDGDPQPVVTVNLAGLKGGDPVAWFDFGEHVPPPHFDPHPSLGVFLRERDAAPIGLTPIDKAVDGWLYWIEWYVIRERIVPLFLGHTGARCDGTCVRPPGPGV